MPCSMLANVRHDSIISASVVHLGWIMFADWRNISLSICMPGKGGWGPSEGKVSMSLDALTKLGGLGEEQVL